MRALSILCLLVFVVACGDKDNTEPPADLVNFEPAASFRLLWSSAIGSGDEQQYLYIEPLVTKNNIITADRDGTVTVLTNTDGEIIHEIDLEATLSAGVGGDADVWLLATRNGEVIAIDADSKAVRWRSRVPSEVLIKPLILNDAAIVRTIDGQMISLDLGNGKINWSYRQTIPALTLRGSGLPIITPGRIYVGLENGRVVALSSDSGEVIWDVALSLPEGRSEIQRLIDIDGHSELYGRILYTVSFQGRIAAIDTGNGQFVWARPFSSYSGVTLSDNLLVSSDERSHVWALDRFNGATLWKQDKLNAREVTRPVRYGEYLVVGDYAGYLHVLSRDDGRFVARVQVSALDDEFSETSADDAGILVPPVVHGDQLLVTTRDGVLHALTLNKL